MMNRVAKLASDFVKGLKRGDPPDEGQLDNLRRRIREADSIRASLSSPGVRKLVADLQLRYDAIIEQLKTQDPRNVEQMIFHQASLRELEWILGYWQRELENGETAVAELSSLSRLGEEID